MGGVGALSTFGADPPLSSELSFHLFIPGHVGFAGSWS
jgi:hypothetical protein